MKVPVYKNDGQKSGDQSFPEALLKAPVRESLLYYMVKEQLAGRRAGTNDSKTRGQVRGSTKKVYRQKGTGRARHGNIRAPIYVGGGKAFGPHPRDYSHSMPKKAKRKALESALKLKLKEEKIKILENLSWESPKTKQAKELFKSLDSTNALLVLASPDDNIQKSVRNLPGFKVLPAAGLNVYDLLLHEDLVISQEALAIVEKRLQLA